VSKVLLADEEGTLDETLGSARVQFELNISLEDLVLGELEGFLGELFVLRNVLFHGVGSDTTEGEQDVAVLLVKTDLEQRAAQSSLNNTVNDGLVLGEVKELSGLGGLSGLTVVNVFSGVQGGLAGVEAELLLLGFFFGIGELLHVLGEGVFSSGRSNGGQTGSNDQFREVLVVGEDDGDESQVSFFTAGELVFTLKLDLSGEFNFNSDLLADGLVSGEFSGFPTPRLGSFTSLGVTHTRSSDVGEEESGDFSVLEVFNGDGVTRVDFDDLSGEFFVLFDGGRLSLFGVEIAPASELKSLGFILGLLGSLVFSDFQELVGFGVESSVTFFQELLNEVVGRIFNTLDVTSEIIASLVISTNCDFNFSLEEVGINEASDVLGSLESHNGDGNGVEAQLNKSINFGKVEGEESASEFFNDGLDGLALVLFGEIGKIIDLVQFSGAGSFDLLVFGVDALLGLEGLVGSDGVLVVVGRFRLNIVKEGGQTFSEEGFSDVDIINDDSTIFTITDLVFSVEENLLADEFLSQEFTGLESKGFFDSFGSVDISKSGGTDTIETESFFEGNSVLGRALENNGITSGDTLDKSLLSHIRVVFGFHCSF